MDAGDFAHEHGTPLLRLALMLTGQVGEAEDLVQETFARLLRDWSAIEGAKSPRAYARRTLVNTHLTRRRRAAREVVVPLVPEGSAPEASSAAGSDTDEAWALLATLPRRQRCVLALRYYEGLDDAEIASLLNISAGAVRTHASRGLAALSERVPAGRALS